MTKYLTSGNLGRKDLFRFIVRGGVQILLERKARPQTLTHWSHRIHSLESEPTGCEARLTNKTRCSCPILPPGLYLIKALQPYKTAPPTGGQGLKLGNPWRRVDVQTTMDTELEQAGIFSTLADSLSPIWPLSSFT